MSRRTQTPSAPKTIIGRISDDLKRQNEHKAVVNYLRKMRASERFNLMIFLIMSPNTPLESGASNDEVLEYAESLSLSRIHTLHRQSLRYKQAQASEMAAMLEEVEAPEKKKKVEPHNETTPLIIHVPNGTEPVSVITISRNEKSPEILNASVLTLESPDYIPVNPRAVAQLLHSTANTLISRQNEIERSAQGH